MGHSRAYGLGLAVIVGTTVLLLVGRVVLVATGEVATVDLAAGWLGPVFLLAALAYTAVQARNQPLTGDDVCRLAEWLLAGLTTLVLGHVLSELSQWAEGHILVIDPFNVVGWAIGGAFLGLIVGNYDVRQRLSRRKLTDARAETERLNERLSVLNRVLRHDIRNCTSVILGYLDFLAEGESGEPTRDREEREDALATIRRQTEQLNRIAERARDLETMLTEGESEPVDVATTVRKEVRTIQREYPMAVVSLDAPESAWGRGNRLLGEAVGEALCNAVRHHPTGEPRVEVTVRRTDDAVQVTVSDDGAGIPDAERAVLLRGEETPLHHSGGVGLWFVKWVVEDAGGSLDIADSDLGGTRLRLEFEPADRETRDDYSPDPRVNS